MARVKGGTTAKTRRRKILKLTKGYFGSKHRLFKTAKEQLMHSWVYAYRDRKQKKREFRKLWIIRINAACRENDMSYSKFMNGLSKANIGINRKMLSEIAIESKEEFAKIVEISKNALNNVEYKQPSVAIKKATKEVVKEEKKEVTKKVVAKKETVKKEVKATKVEKTVKKPVVKKAVKAKTATKTTKKTK